MPENFLDSIDIPYEGKSPEQFLALATEVVKKLGWENYSIDEEGLSAFAKSPISGKEVSIIVLYYKDRAHAVVMLGEDHPGDHPYIEDFQTKYTEIKDDYAAEELNRLHLELEPGIEAPITATDRLKSVKAIFIPAKDYFVTPILIYINIIVFILMVLSGVNFMEPDNESLLAWGANFRPSTMDNEIWRLFTCSFLHIGILHLLMNCYALLYIGVLVEPYLGRLRFTVAYILTGLVASVTSLWWHDYIISAGASGAIFGMYGVFLALLLTNYIKKEQRMPLLTSVGIFVLYNLFSGMEDGIDNAAHVGGLVSGLLIGFAMIPGIRNTESAVPGRRTLAMVCALVLGFVCIVYTNIPNDISRYEKMIKTWSKNEETALNLYNLPDTTPNDIFLDEINYGISKWNENISLLKTMQKLDISEELKSRNRKLLRYCELRLANYILFKKTFETGVQDTIYNDEIQKKDREIEIVLKEINS